MKNNEEGRSKAPIIITGIALLAIIGGILCFIFKPCGDRYPFDDFLYKVSKVSKMKYRILNKGKGRKVKDEDLALLNFSYRKKKQKAPIFNTRDRKMTWPFQYKKELKEKQKEGFNFKLNEAVSMLRKKGKIRIRLTLDDMFSKNDKKEREDFKKKNNITEKDEIIVEFDVENITTQKEYQEENKKKLKEFTDKIKAKAEARFKNEIKLIDEKIKKEYPKSRVFKVQDEKGKDSGIRYIKVKEGNGRRIKEGNDVKLTYGIKMFEDDKKIEKANKISKTHKVGEKSSELPKGVHLALAHLKEKDIIKLWVPSKQAYGISGLGNFVKPNQILYFEIEVNGKMYLNAG